MAAGSVEDRLNPVEVISEFDDGSLDRHIVSQQGRLLNLAAIIGDRIESVAAARTFHAVADEPDLVEIRAGQQLADALHIVATVAEETGDQVFEIRVYADFYFSVHPLNS